MGKKIQVVLESDADCGEETFDQPMLDVPKNTTCPASDGFESDSNSGNEAPNPGDGKLPMGFMIKVYLQSPIPFSMMIPMPICIHHQRRQKHVDPKRRNNALHKGANLAFRRPARESRKEHKSSPFSHCGPSKSQTAS